MLVLTRISGQSVIINGNIKVTVLPNPRGNGVRLGFTAPREIDIIREELVGKKQDDGNRQPCMTHERPIQ